MNNLVEIDSREANRIDYKKYSLECKPAREAAWEAATAIVFGCEWDIWYRSEPAPDPAPAFGIRPPRPPGMANWEPNRGFDAAAAAIAEGSRPQYAANGKR